MQSPTFYVGQPVIVINPNCIDYNARGSVKFIDGGFIGVSIPGVVTVPCFAESDLQPVEAAPVAEQIVVADILDNLVIAVEVARINAAGNTRWLKALETGYDWLVQQDAIVYDREGHDLMVPSASVQGRVYWANGDCQCDAFRSYNACWHRAASRLVRRALELQARAAQVKPVRSQAEKARIDAEMAELFC